MDIIWEELKRNKIDIDKDMLSFYISKCLHEHEELYGAIIIQIGDNFGRIMAYLTVVYKFDETLWILTKLCVLFGKCASTKQNFSYFFWKRKDWSFKHVPNWGFVCQMYWPITDSHCTGWDKVFFSLLLQYDLWVLELKWDSICNERLSYESNISVPLIALVEIIGSWMIYGKYGSQLNYC